MPGFASALTDQEVASLVSYLRARYSGRPAWTGVEDAVRRARQEGGA